MPNWDDVRKLNKTKQNNRIQECNIIADLDSRKIQQEIYNIKSCTCIFNDFMRYCLGIHHIFYITFSLHRNMGQLS